VEFFGVTGQVQLVGFRFIDIDTVDFDDTISMVPNSEVLTDKCRDVNKMDKVGLIRLDRITLTDRIVEQERVRDWLSSGRVDMNSCLISSTKV
jgi:hypothetical protein